MEQPHPRCRQAGHAARTPRRDAGGDRQRLSLPTGARQLVGLIPVAGIVPRVAVAYAGTLAIGKTVVAWTTYGARSEPSAVRRFYWQARSRDMHVASALVTQARHRAPRRPRLRSWRG